MRLCYYLRFLHICMGIVFCSISGVPKITHLKPPYFRLSVSSVQWRLRNSTTMMFNCLRNKPLYIVIFFLPNSSICDSLQSLLSISFTLHLLARQLRMRSPSSPLCLLTVEQIVVEAKKSRTGAAVDKILSGGRLLPGNCLSVFQCVPQELPSILPLCAAQIAYFARTRLRIKLCHVLHAQTWDFLCLL